MISFSVELQWSDGSLREVSIDDYAAFTMFEVGNTSPINVYATLPDGSRFTLRERDARWLRMGALRGKGSEA